MKILVGILLLLNVIFFAVMQWGGDLFATHLSGVAQPPLHAEKISLIQDTATVDSITVAASAIVATPLVETGNSEPAPSPKTTVTQSAVVAASAPGQTQASANVCMEWGDFSGVALERATAALQNLKLGNKLTQRQIEHAIGFWVFVGPLKDKVTVTQKIAQLKARGIEDYFVVQDDPQWINTISLGLFKTREAAQNFLIALQAQDVRTAQIGERSSKQKTTQWLIRDLDAATADKIKALQGKFANSEVKNIACD